MLETSSKESETVNNFYIDILTVLPLKTAQGSMLDNGQ